VCGGADCDCVCVCAGAGYELPGDWRRIALEVGHVADRALSWHRLRISAGEKGMLSC